MFDDICDDPKKEEEWIALARNNVEAYLADEKLKHGTIAGWPAWHIAPLTSIWAIESKIRPGWVGWWAIYGDHPTDYISAQEIRHPRAAIRAFINQWTELANCIQRGEKHPTIRLGNLSPSAELAELLVLRIQMLREMAVDDSLWDYAESQFQTDSLEH